MGKSFSTSISRLSILAIAASFILGTLLRVETIAQDPLWHDEILSIVRMHSGNKAAFIQIESSNRALTGDSLIPLIESSRKGPARGRIHMPAFYLLEHAFSLPFENTRIGAKIFSLLCGALLPLAVALLASRLSLGNVAPPLVALLVALNPTLIAYSVEARPYSALLLTVTVYLYLLLSPSPATIRQSIFLGVVTLLGTFTHLLFLPIAWLGILLNWIFLPASFLELKRAGTALTVASFSALPWIASVLGSSEAANHFTNQTTTTSGVLLATSNVMSVLLGTALPDVSYLGLGVLLCGLIFALRQESVRARVAMLTLFAPMLGLLLADLALGGIRSTVPRYSLTIGIALALTIGLLLQNIWRSHRIMAAISFIAILSAQIIAPCEIAKHLKGGRYEELAWYTQTCGNQACLTFSLLPGNRAIEFAANSYSSSTIIPISGNLPQPLRTQATSALDRGVPVLAITPLDGIPPMAPGEDTRWVEEFVGAQTSVYRLARK